MQHKKPNTPVLRMAQAVLIGCLIPQAWASGFDPSGLRPPQCDQYQLKSAVKYENGKAPSADTGEYVFSAMMSEGMAGKSCGGTDPDPTGTYKATIESSWDGKSMKATEIIHSQPPAVGKITTLQYSCPENPWTSDKNPDCKVISSISDYKRIIQPAIAGPYPVTAYRIGYKGRENIANATFNGSAAFILPPQLPPTFDYKSEGGLDGLFLKRQDIPVTVKRPKDGSPEWYAANLKSYDIELEAETKASGSDKYAIAKGWSVNHVVKSVSADSPSFVLPYTKLFSDPTENWQLYDYGTRGVCRTFRIRVRIHDDVISRPWLNWQLFMLEAPKVMKKVPRAVDVPGVGGK